MVCNTLCSHQIMALIIAKDEEDYQRLEREAAARRLLRKLPGTCLECGKVHPPSPPIPYIEFHPEHTMVTEYCDKIESSLPDAFLPREEVSLLRRMRDFHDRNLTFCRNCYVPPPCVPKDPPKYHRYFLTIQWNRKCSEEEWRLACDKFLKDKKFKHGVYAYERGEKGTNPHCHLFVFCKSKICHNAKKNNHPKDQYKGHFKMFQYTYGHIDFQVVPKDNGIEKYISKETKLQYFSNTTESVHPITNTWLSLDASSPSDPASVESDLPSSDEE